jgi:DNA-binding transcriptional LysR family regulator
MTTIPQSYEGEPDLHHLQVLDVLLREHSLTRAARVLDVTQPALSKTLAHLRRYFDDPLFVRVALRMEPTPKALLLQAPVRAILEQMRSLRTEHISFDPRTSHRTFKFCVVDAGLIKLLPPLVDRLLDEAPNVRLHVQQLEAQHLEPWLESGQLDFAMGSFPALTKGIRRQHLWEERYVSIARRNHPRLSSEPTLRAFAAEKHVLVSIAGSGHAHQKAERALEAAIPAENVVCRIPMFIGAAIVAKQTNAVATLPLSVATVLVKDLDLQIIAPPLKLPKIDIFQYWHDRLHRDPGNQWIRSIFKQLFSSTALRNGRKDG